MQLNDLLRIENIDPARVVVLRHRPHEPTLRKVLPWLAAEKPDVFNAYQQTQVPKLEQAFDALVGEGYVASFIGHAAGQALFVGLYAIRGARAITFDEFWQMPAYVEMKTYGMQGWAEPTTKPPLWFDLDQTPFYQHWRGRLIVEWPPPERSWWRRAHRNVMPVSAILEESTLSPSMPEWHDLALAWKELGILPTSWKTALSHWRGIYYIVDESDGKGYVGSAYGESNLLGRWMNYADRGHGGNVLLRARDPQHFRFAILERVSPDMDATDVIRREASWKQRLRTHAPHGLNDN